MSSEEELRSSFRELEAQLKEAASGYSIRAQSDFPTRMLSGS